MILGNNELYKSCRNSTSIAPTKKRENDSFFIEALDMLTESNREINSILYSMHENVILSEQDSNQTYIHEFKINFESLVEKVIDAFVGIIKTLWKKFITYMERFFYDDQTILKNEKEFKRFTGVFGVDYERYIYTVSDSRIPMVDLKMEFEDELGRLQDKLDSLSKIKNSDERKYRMQSLESEIGKTDMYYDQLRQRVLQTTYSISVGYWSEELFNVFRNGGKKVVSKVTDTEVSDTFDRFKNSRKMIKEAEKDKSRVIKSAESIKKQIRSITLASKNKYYIPYEEQEEYLFGKILNKEVGVINEVCNIFTMAYSAKIEAIKESMVQDKKLLYDALRYIRLYEAD